MTALGWLEANNPLYKDVEIIVQILVWILQI